MPDSVHWNKNLDYRRWKNERTIDSEVNYSSLESSPQMLKISIRIQKGLTSILGHFQEPIWPRTISTNATEGRQVVVNSEREALARFKEANWMDCRISAYPPEADENASAVERFYGIKKTTPPSLIILIDLDRCNFKSQRAFDFSLSTTLKNIKYRLGEDVNPTVLWSGNGYHIYLVLDSNQVNLEYEQIFTILTDQPSRRFLQFAETFLSVGRSDGVHNRTVSFRNCMLRIPGSFNSKNNAQVTIVQSWDGRRKPEINYLLSDFCVYLVDQKAKELIAQQRRPNTTFAQVRSGSYTIQWIERILQTPISDGRKYSIWRILVPYLMNRRHLLDEQCTTITFDWLYKCGELSRLGFNAKYRIKDSIKHVGTYGPVHPNKMKQEYPKFYDLLLSYGVLL
jgi:hypothetical protein